MERDKCNKCGKCCKYVEFAFSGEISDGELGFYIARGFGVFSYTDHFVVQVPSICPHLTPENLCDIHETKPPVCKNWGVDNFISSDWPAYPDGCGYISR